MFDPARTPPPAPPPPLTPGRAGVIRLLVFLTLALGFFYLSWRYAFSLNWAAWPIAIALLLASERKRDLREVGKISSGW